MNIKNDITFMYLNNTNSKSNEYIQDNKYVQYNSYDPMEKNFNIGKKTFKDEIKYITYSIYNNSNEFNNIIRNQNSLSSLKDNNLQHHDKSHKTKKNLIIIDWDDTIFPTSWILKNNINIITKNYINDSNIVKIIYKLDIVLYKLLELMISLGKVIIITNATTSWIKQCCSILLKSNEIIIKNIEIISANDNYSKKYPSKISLWKKKEFYYQVLKYLNNNDHIFMNNINKNTFGNLNKINNELYVKTNINKHSIISIGDSNYEYNALVNLYDNINNIVNLKTVKFKQDISIENFIEQIIILRENMEFICEINNHADLIFLNK